MLTPVRSGSQQLGRPTSNGHPQNDPKNKTETPQTTDLQANTPRSSTDTEPVAYASFLVGFRQGESGGRLAAGGRSRQGFRSEMWDLRIEVDEDEGRGRAPGGVGVWGVKKAQRRKRGKGGKL